MRRRAHAANLKFHVFDKPAATASFKSVIHGDVTGIIIAPDLETATRDAQLLFKHPVVLQVAG
jgi:hypothetical protein